MEPQEYEKMDRLEDWMWWYLGLHAHLAFFLRKALAESDNPVVLDAGCGTGGLLRCLAQVLPKSSIFGLDAEEQACFAARLKSRCPVCAGSVNIMPFADNVFSAIVSADVLSQGGVSDAQALLNFNRCLARGGTLVLNLPAYQWLYSAHDRAVGTNRRYTKKRLRELLHAAGFGSIKTMYWNTFLFPLMVLRRVLTRTQPGSDVLEYPVAINVICGYIMRLELSLIKLGVRLPFGGSVLAVAVKGGDTRAPAATLTIARPTIIRG